MKRISDGRSEARCYLPWVLAIPLFLAAYWLYAATHWPETWLGFFLLGIGWIGLWVANRRLTFWGGA